MWTFSIANQPKLDFAFCILCILFYSFWWVEREMEAYVAFFFVMVNVIFFLTLVPLFEITYI